MKQQKIAIITGGADGLGKALTQQLSQSGMVVIALDIQEDKLNHTIRQLQSDQLEAYGKVCDISDRDSCLAVFNEIVEEHGRIDLLINNAGITHLSTFVDSNYPTLRKVVEVNFWGAVHCTQAALPHLIRSQGEIVVISSIAGFAPLMGRTAYAASKYALHGFFESLRTELRESGVSIMMVCPSTIDTQIRKSAISDQKSASQQSIGKVASPTDVASEIVLHLSHRKRLLIIGRMGVLSFLIQKISPRLFDWLMVRKVEPQLRGLKVVRERRRELMM